MTHRQTAYQDSSVHFPMPCKSPNDVTTGADVNRGSFTYRR